MVSLDTVKQLLRISDTDSARDAFIEYMIPIVYADIVDECNYSFSIDDYEIVNDDIYFSASTIHLAAGGFAAMNLPNGGTLIVEGSRLNDGIYTIVSQTDTAISVSQNVESETQPATHYYITLKLVSFPKPFELIAARMIGYQLSNSNSSGITSMSLGNYSESRSAQAGSYPDEIMEMLHKYKKMRTGKGSIIWHINENRRYFPRTPDGYEGINGL